MYLYIVIYTLCLCISCWVYPPPKFDDWNLHPELWPPYHCSNANLAFLCRNLNYKPCSINTPTVQLISFHYNCTSRLRVIPTIMASVTSLYTSVYTSSASQRGDQMLCYDIDTLYCSRPKAGCRWILNIHNVVVIYRKTLSWWKKLIMRQCRHLRMNTS